MNSPYTNTSILSNRVYKQIQCLKELEMRYENVDMSAISEVSKFTDDIWIRTSLDEPDFQWSKYFTPKQYPLMLLCKITVYRYISISGGATSYIQYVVSFINKFKNLLEQKGILTINTNTAIKSLSQLTIEDITEVAQRHILKTDTNFDIQALSFINTLNNLPNEAVREAPFIHGRLDLPWTTNIQDWLKELNLQLGFVHTRKPYPAIPFETVSTIVQCAEPWVSEERINVISDIFGILRNYQDLRQEAAQIGKPRINEEITDLIVEKYRMYFKSILPMTFDAEGLLSSSWLSDLYQLARSSCALIILLTTGIRNVDLRMLQVGCCKASNRSDLLYYLVLNIKKTHLKNYVIPVPETTYRAVKLLENMRWDLSSKFLINKVSLQRHTVAKRRKGEEWAMADGKGVTAMIHYFFEYYGISLIIKEDTNHEATAHCFRATLAGWIGEHSSISILLLKKLFGHTNSVMPDAYLKHNPIVQKKRKENLETAQKKMANSISEAIFSGKVSGGKASALKKGIEAFEESESHKLKSSSKTEGEIHLSLQERFTELLFERISSGQMFAMLTPLSVICLRNSNDTSESPCSHDKYRMMRNDSNFNKAILETLGTLPSPENCIGNKCKDSLMGNWSLPLYETYLFYIEYLQHIHEGEVDLVEEANLFVKQYAQSIQEVFGYVNGEHVNEG